MSTLISKVYIKIVSLMVAIFRIFLRGFLSLVYAGRKQVVPPIRDPLLFKSAVALAADIREGKIKCEDVIKSYCARIREVNPYINAVCENRFNDALNEAKEVDILVASATKTPQQIEDETPLLGVPFSVKLLLSVKGMACNSGSFVHKDVRAHEDAATVALMKKAGAICLVTTNCPEFGINFETYNIIYGRTSNPYDVTRTAGGSSGGEGALIGAGGSIMGIGSDIAGSIRHPSNFNGIFGHKPTVGLISNDGMFPPVVMYPKLNELLATGPMCRYMEDLILMTKILSGQNVANIKVNRPVDFSKLKIHYFFEDGNPLAQKVSHEIKSVIMDAVLHFESTHRTYVQKVNIERFKLITFIYVHMLVFAVNGRVEDLFSGGKRALNPSFEILKKVFCQSKITAGAMVSMHVEKLPMVFRRKNQATVMRCLEKLKDEIDAFLDDQSVLFLPSFSTTAHYHYELLPLLPNVSFMCIFNILGYPVTQCPIRLSNDKLPLGFQIVGAKGQDHLTLACAAELEKAFGGWIPPNTVPVQNKNVTQNGTQIM